MSRLRKSVTTLLPSTLIFLVILPAIAGNYQEGDPHAIRAISGSQQWRGQQGQIALDWPPILGRDATLRQESLNALLRLGGDEQLIPFAQFGFNRVASGRTFNIGIGQRRLCTSNTLWGLNLFYDYQLKAHHQRLGIGTEVQRDFLKLAVNGYIPLSGLRALKNSVTDRVRPAWGIDAHIETYLPHYPWVGFSAVGEYYPRTAGKVVDPQGFQKMCHPAVTLGFNYMPIPLFKISYAYTMGKQEHRDHSVNLQFTYRFKLSPQEQLQADQVGRLRALQGGHLELVSRSYQITLNKITSPRIDNPGRGNIIDLELDRIEREIKYYGEFISTCVSDGSLVDSRVISSLRGELEKRRLKFKEKILDGQPVSSTEKQLKYFRKLSGAANIEREWDRFLANTPLPVDYSKNFMICHNKRTAHITR